MLPIINRGTWARVHSIRQVIKRFIKICEEKGQLFNILSLGAGFDSTYFWLKKENLFPKGCKYVEIDFPNLIEKKAQVISMNEEMMKIAEGFSLDKKGSDEYLMLGCDVRSGE